MIPFSLDPALQRMWAPKMFFERLRRKRLGDQKFAPAPIALARMSGSLSVVMNPKVSLTQSAAERLQQLQPRHVGLCVQSESTRIGFRRLIAAVPFGAVLAFGNVVAFESGEAQGFLDDQ